VHSKGSYGVLQSFLPVNLEKRLGLLILLDFLRGVYFQVLSTMFKQIISCRSAKIKLHN
jgi:hypothetical protein